MITAPRTTKENAGYGCIDSALSRTAFKPTESLLIMLMNVKMPIFWHFNLYEHGQILCSVELSTKTVELLLIYDVFVKNIN